MTDPKIRAALMEDAQRMEQIATDCGIRANTSPYEADASTADRFFWAIAVAMLHLLKAEIRRIERDARTETD